MEIRPERWYLSTIGDPLCVWHRSFRSMAEAMRYRQAEGLPPEYHAVRGSTLLGWAETRRVPIRPVEARR